MALVVGNANYQDADTPLKSPVRDARALGLALRRAGFDVDVAENLTKEELRHALDRFYDKIKPGTVALIFFSGYGIQSNRQNYLIPIDAHIWTEADVRREGMSVASVLSEVADRGPSAAIAVLDASRRNPFERRYRLTPAGLAAVSPGPGTLVAHAAAPSSLIDDANRGLFVGELIKQISNPDAPIPDVFNRTSLAVSQASQGGQVPWISSALGDDVPFGEKSSAFADKPDDQQTTGQTADSEPEVATDKSTSSETAKPDTVTQSVASQDTPSSTQANAQAANTTTSTAAPPTRADSSSSTNTATALVARADPDAGRADCARDQPLRCDGHQGA